MYQCHLAFRTLPFARFFFLFSRGEIYREDTKDKLEVEEVCKNFNLRCPRTWALSLLRFMRILFFTRNKVLYEGINSKGEINSSLNAQMEAAIAI